MNKLGNNGLIVMIPKTGLFLIMLKESPEKKILDLYYLCVLLDLLEKIELKSPLEDSSVLFLVKDSLILSLIPLKESIKNHRNLFLFSSYLLLVPILLQLSKISLRKRRNSPLKMFPWEKDKKRKLLKSLMKLLFQEDGLFFKIAIWVSDSWMISWHLFLLKVNLKDVMPFMMNSDYSLLVKREMNSHWDFFKESLKLQMNLLKVLKPVSTKLLQLWLLKISLKNLNIMLGELWSLLYVWNILLSKKDVNSDLLDGVFLTNSIILTLMLVLLSLKNIWIKSYLQFLQTKVLMLNYPLTVMLLNIWFLKSNMEEKLLIT